MGRTSTPPSLPAPGQILMPAADLVERLARGVALTGLHVEGEAAASDGARHVTTQPAQRFHGRIADWVPRCASGGRPARP